MIFIGIDISFAKNIGIAWSDGKLTNVTSIVFEKKEIDKETRDLHQMAKKVFKFLVKDIGLSNSNNIYIGIEGQWMGLNPSMVIGLIELRSLIQGMILIKYPKIHVSTVDPRSWQARILNVSRMKSKEIKEVSIKEAAKYTGKTHSEDESDAVHIMRYVEKYNGPNSWTF